LLKNIAAYEQVRKEKTISLNLKERQQEREQLDKARLDRENARRVVDGQKPVDSLEALEKQKEEVPDGLLNEAAEITADLDTWLTRNRQASINVSTPARK